MSSFSTHIDRGHPSRHCSDSCYRPWRQGSTEANIVIRSDQHGQNIYGPSMCTIESSQPSSLIGINGKVQATALGISKASHEFLTLHYVATDSAPQWNLVVAKQLPTLPFKPAGRRPSACCDLCTLLRHTVGTLIIPGEMH